MKLSSNYLFHYTKSIATVQEILKKGFRFGLVTETIPYKKYTRDNFMVCFCDIKSAKQKNIWNVTVITR